MDDNYILDDNGDPVPEPDLLKWGEWFQTNDRRIAQTRIGDSRVSTVFLGLDHRFGDGDPLLFETMVFGGPKDGEQRRYTTKAAAISGHNELVGRLTRERLPKQPA